MSRIAKTLAPRAEFLQRTLGTRCAAGFLRNRDVCLQEALFILCGTRVVRGDV